MSRAARTAWAAAVVVPAAVVVGFLLVTTTRIGGWGYLVGPLLAVIAAWITASRAEPDEQSLALFGLSALTAVVTAIVMGIVAVLIVLLEGL